MATNKKTRTTMEQTEKTMENMALDDDEQDEDEDEFSDDYDDEEDFDSDASDDDEELAALELLSEQMQEAKQANLQLKQALGMVVNGEHKTDNSSRELVASLFAGRKQASMKDESSSSDKK